MIGSSPTRNTLVSTYPPFIRKIASEGGSTTWVGSPAGVKVVNNPTCRGPLHSFYSVCCSGRQTMRLVVLTKLKKPIPK